MDDHTPQCCKKVYGEREYHGHQCLRRGIVKREGKWYCKQHDPIARQQREDAQEAEYAAEWKKRDERARRLAACEEACTGMTDPVRKVRAMREACETFLRVWEHAGPNGAAQWEKFDTVVRAIETVLAK